MNKQDIKIRQARTVLENAVKKALKGDSFSSEMANFSLKMADAHPKSAKEFKRKAKAFTMLADKEEKEKYFSMQDFKCPVCHNQINWVKNVGDMTYNNEIILLAECWSGEFYKDADSHLFIIRLNNLPELDLTSGDKK